MIEPNGERKGESYTNHESKSMNYGKLKDFFET
jgi:hypothetical protein